MIFYEPEQLFSERRTAGMLIRADEPIKEHAAAAAFALYSYVDMPMCSCTNTHRYIYVCAWWHALFLCGVCSLRRRRYFFFLLFLKVIGNWGFCYGIKQVLAAAKTCRILYVMRCYRKRQLMKIGAIRCRLYCYRGGKNINLNFSLKCLFFVYTLDREVVCDYF